MKDMSDEVIFNVILSPTSASPQWYHSSGFTDYILYNNFQLYVFFRENCLYAHALTIFIKEAR
jgi:hypothetical protein